ncbi:putative bifunctional diguanylate cyclase/phosphodiesterase [Luteibacter aegosomatissinici]|uniref:putative bifunctional diguanylate cyclase/phosphodiesterase n=1 Tax=Luteibacter aegosomatissinici TaxID=2911539 RepID=UPI001FFB5E55|nr:EAL domain-containing protein [Luteibacter aegosomatissinici]UPG92632.1 EAL domain-containing protein [Luteibacter aegosomatissinici]
MTEPQEWLMRHRFQIWDAAVVLAVAGVLVFLGFEYDLLRHLGVAPGKAGELELAELIAVVVVVGVFVVVMQRRMKAQSQEVERRIVAEREARVLALQDPLTGLANRRRFDEAVATAVAAPPGSARVHAVFMLDLNRFKLINDVYGHPIGDQVLTIVAGRIKGCVRRHADVVARLGGDEFAIVANHLFGPEEATSIALRIIESLKQPVRVGDNEHSVGVGIGVAFYPQDAQAESELVRRADIALYRAKSERGSAVKFFLEEMDEQVRVRAELESALRKAVIGGDIQVHFQPQVDLQTGALTGFEALARWHHAAWGDIPPERFIPIAEECGVINALGAHVLGEACREAMSWDGNLIVSVNVSPVQLHLPDFAAMVTRTLDESGLPPGRLELEITENTLVRDLQAAQTALAGLRDLGVRIALDDFGTGYSSLYHLRSFKVDRIKIDRSFVDSMATEAESVAIVRALLGLGHGLGVKVTAEGVEDAAQRRALLGEGCDEAQGFLFSEALTAEEARRLTGRDQSHVCRS